METTAHLQSQPKTAKSCVSKIGYTRFYTRSTHPQESTSCSRNFTHGATHTAAKIRSFLQIHLKKEAKPANPAIFNGAIPSTWRSNKCNFFVIALLALIIALVPVSESELQKLRGDLKEIHSKLELLIKNSGISKRKDFYTIAECADYISQKKRHVENLVSSREIKVHRSGRSVRIRHEDLERYLTKNRG